MFQFERKSRAEFLSANAASNIKKVEEDSEEEDEEEDYSKGFC